MGLKEEIIKQGGTRLLKQYWASGALFTAMGEFVLLGKSRTALEILRLSTHLKAKQKLEKKYSKTLKEFDRDYQDTSEHMGSKKIWLCWFQGIEMAPELVKRCVESIQKNLPSREVVIITSENMQDYVPFPDFIMDKWKSGQITHTHMTDLLRLELLIRYGGTWMDATVFCSEREENIPSYFFDSDLFFFQSLKPGRDGHSHINSSWFMTAKSNNKYLMACRHLCYAYWEEHSSMIDYFLLHDFMAICLEHYPDIWKAIVPRDNATPHILLLRLFDRYDEDMWQAIRKQTPFHKLSYKTTEDKKNLADTYYDILIKEG